MRMRGIVIPVLMIVSAVAADVRPSAAQIRFAPTLAWGEDHDLALGGRLLINMSRVFSRYTDEGLKSKIDLVIPFDWFVDCASCTYFEITPGLILPLTVKDIGPYLGAGLNIARVSIDTPNGDNSDMEIGLGLTGGFLIPIKSVISFGEVRYTVGGAKQTVVTFGLQLGRSQN